MRGTYFEGEKALERLGDLTELICRIAEGSGIGGEDEILLEGLLLEMGAALRDRDLPRAKKVVARMLSDVLGYDEVRAGFVVRNHLNRNAGWE